MFEETHEERPIATSVASPGEAVVKALGVGYREDERGWKGGKFVDVMLIEGVRTCRKRGRDEGTEPRP